MPDQYTVMEGGLSDSGGRQMGCLPRRLPCGERPCFQTLQADELIPESEWQEISLRHLFWHVYDQDGIGQCTCCASSAMVLGLREEQGLPRVVLSSGNLYNRVCGGVDRGSALDDALEELVTNGVCTADLQDPNEWRTLAPGWKQEARHFKVLEFTDLNGSVAGLFSSLQRRQPVVIGVNWPGGGGHCVLAVGCRKDSRGNWEAEILNSWKKSWGDGGFGFLAQATLRTMPQFGCWAGRVATSSPG